MFGVGCDGRFLFVVDSSCLEFNVLCCVLLFVVVCCVVLVFVVSCCSCVSCLVLVVLFSCRCLLRVDCECALFVVCCFRGVLMVVGFDI